MDNPYIQAEINRLENEIRENEILVSDPELGTLATAEITRLKTQLENLLSSTENHASDEAEGDTESVSIFSPRRVKITVI